MECKEVSRRKVCNPEDSVITMSSIETNFVPQFSKLRKTWFFLKILDNKVKNREEKKLCQSLF